MKRMITLTVLTMALAWGSFLFLQAVLLREQDFRRGLYRPLRGD